MNLFERCRQSAQVHPDRLALRFRDGSREEAVTYSELFDRAERMATCLASRDLKLGDRLALFLGNRLETAVVFLASLRLGTVLVPINLAYRKREIIHILQNAEPRLLISERNRFGLLAELTSDDKAGLDEILLVEDLAKETPSLEPRRNVAPEAGDLALLLYTSGTTGKSKGAMLSHDNLLATIEGLLQAWAWQSQDCLLLCLPLFHTHGLIVGLATALAAGASVELRPRFVAKEIWAELESGRPTLFFGVPTMYVRLLAEKGTESVASGLPGMRLFCSGSAPLAAGTHRRFRELTGHEILERYGMTETGMNLSNPYLGDRIPGAVGTALPGVSICILDAQGGEVELGVPGTLLVSGRNVFSGYWREPEKSADSFVRIGERKYFRTGDLAVEDPATGSIRLLGREGDLIIRGGLNIYPKEIEEVLLSAANITEAAVVARSDSEWGEVPVAFLVVLGDWDPGRYEEHCREQMASFKVPREFRRVQSLPRNALGKIQKHRLRRLLELA